MHNYHNLVMHSMNSRVINGNKVGWDKVSAYVPKTQRHFRTGAKVKYQSANWRQNRHPPFLPPFPLPSPPTTLTTL